MVLRIWLSFPASRMHLPSDAAQLCGCKNEGEVAVPATLRGILSWLLAALLRLRNAKTRVDERSTRDFAFYLAGSRAGLCRCLNRGWLLWLRWFPALVALCGAALCPSFSLYLSLSLSFSLSLSLSLPLSLQQCMNHVSRLPIYLYI